MCAAHWSLVPMELRLRLETLRRERAGASLPYRIAEASAVHAVSISEETRDKQEFERAQGECWRAARAKLQGELGPRYLAEVRPYRKALRKLMADAAYHDPLFVCSCALSFDVQEPDRTARRIAAALDVLEAKQERRKP